MSTRFVDPRTGEATVNRPFGAFVTLLVFMTLAVIALSASRRSTSVSSASRRTIATFRHKPAGGTNYVFVIPAAKSLDEGSGHGLQGDAEIEPDSCASEQLPVRKQLIPAVVQAVKSVENTTATIPAMDSLAHHDAEYDWVVNGHADDIMSAEIFNRNSLSADEIVSLFDDLGVQHANWHPVSPSRVLSVWLKLSSATAAARLWLVYQWHCLIDGLALPAEPDQQAANEWQWGEYSEFIDLAVAGNSRNSELTSPLVYRAHVRFGDPVRYSAASIFDDWTPVLGHVSDELEP